MTAADFNSLLDDYRAIEMEVNRLMEGACTPFCRVCKNPCCRIEICQEAAESPFLLAVQNIPPLGKPAFSQKSGYLGCTGCTLKVGRPPICHAFVCSLIITSQPSDLHRYALECLGDLVTYIGAKVWLGRHLVETITDRDLDAIHLGKFAVRLATAQAALNVLKPFFTEATPLGPQEMTLLAPIRKPFF